VHDEIDRFNDCKRSKVNRRRIGFTNLSEIKNKINFCFFLYFFRKSEMAQYTALTKKHIFARKVSLPDFTYVTRIPHVQKGHVFRVGF